MFSKTTSLLLAAAAFTTISCLAADKAGSKDHPLLKRYEGSSIVWYQQKNFDSLKMALETIEFDYGNQVYKPYKKLGVEGKTTTLYYNLPAGISTLEGIRQYENELKASGFELLYQASGAGIEKNKGDNLVYEIYGVTPANTNQDNPQFQSLTGLDATKCHYAVARLARPDAGDVYAAIYAFEASYTAGSMKVPEKTTLIRVDLCELKGMEQKMVLVKAEEMANQIAVNGKVALYGILFDFNQATIRPDSEPALAEISKLLAENPTLNVLVVGHTDIEGAFEYNRTLSQKRAESVVANLVGKGVASQRLFPVGVSFASPVATNATEEGRAKNRRVELVDMGKGAR